MVAESPAFIPYSWHEPRWASAALVNPALKSWFRALAALAMTKSNRSKPMISRALIRSG
jgi:hypothetical protein